MWSLRKILTVGGAVLGAAVAINAGVNLTTGFYFTVVGSGITPLTIAAGKFIVHAVGNLFEAQIPESCQFVRQDIATIFAVGATDIAFNTQDEMTHNPHICLFRTLFVAGAGNLAPAVHEAINQVIVPPPDRVRLV